MFFNPYMMQTGGTKRSFEENIMLLKREISNADAVLIGAGSGLSTAAGYVYSGERFGKYFYDFEERYHFHDMYSGGFYPYDSIEAFWGFWCRSIWLNRYAPIPSGLYEDLLGIIKDKDYFVITTNVDHCFQRAGFDKKRLFYTQGDYGLFQSSRPEGTSDGKTYDNYEIIRKMIISEGFEIAENGELYIPDNADLKMEIPSELVPYCPDDGKLMTTNLRCDDSFAEDAGWQKARMSYQDFLRRHERLHVLFFELGVGMNTPAIIKFPFWNYTEQNKNAVYVCVNKGEAGCSDRIVKQSICIDAGIDEVIKALEL